MSFTAFSQTLKPTVLTVNLDTNFCFTMPQSKVIAKYIVKGQFADSLEVKYEQEITDYKIRSFKSDGIQQRLESKIFNQDLIINNNEQSILILTEQLNDRDKRLKRAKWHKIILGVASLASSAAIIFK